ncbi:hypothetical protein BS50DRAFT_582147 [Corynespora cassiicola Philippines]|uniref:Uncharacterized protein n=1 Tax=Corynespora cassiicola Philippines TaxID=1448308 RepID=A0A2T2PCR8_CORCC|nr:hypothetical protein BS50DRAFT_582147 [Corynespora cassiicola Philippines]
MAGNSPSGDGRKLTKEMIKMNPHYVPTFENIFYEAISSPFDINIIRDNLNTRLPPVSSKQCITTTPSLPLENKSKRKDDPSSISTSSVKVTGKIFDDNGSGYTKFKASRSIRSTRAKTSTFYAYDSTGKRIEVLKRKPKQMSRYSFHEGDIGLYQFGQPCLDGQSTGLIETKTGGFSVKYYPVVIVTKQFDAMMGAIISSSGGRGLSGKPESLRDRCIYVESMGKEPHQLPGDLVSSQNMAQKGDNRLSGQNLGFAGKVSEAGAKTRHDSSEKKTASNVGKDAVETPAESVRESIIGSTTTSTRTQALQERIPYPRKRRTSRMEDDSNLSEPNLSESNLPKRRRMNDTVHIRSRYGDNFSGPGYALSQGTRSMAQRRFNGKNRANMGNYGGRSREGSGRSVRGRQSDVYRPNSSISRVYRG